MAKYFSAFIHIYIVYGMDPAQLLHVVVKQASILYFRFEFCTKMVFCFSFIANCAKPDAPIKGPKHVSIYMI